MQFLQGLGKMCTEAILVQDLHRFSNPSRGHAFAAANVLMFYYNTRYSTNASTSFFEFAHNVISSSRRISHCLRPFGCCRGRRVPGLTSLDFALTNKKAQFTDVFVAGWIYPHLFRTLPAWISCCQPAVFLHQVWSQVLLWNMPHGLQSTATSRSCFPGFWHCPLWFLPVSQKVHLCMFAKMAAT